MTDFKVQQKNFSVFQTSSKISKSFSTDFQSFFDEKISAIPADFSKYKCGVSFGQDMNFSFPPDDAPDYFKNAWYDVTSKMDSDFRAGNFNGYVTTSIQYGYYFCMFDAKEGAAGYNAMNNRVETLGAVGCLQLAIRSTEQSYNDNVLGGNEKFFTDKIKSSLEAMQEIMKQCLLSGDKNISKQIELADIDFEQSKAQILQEAEIWLQKNDSEDWRTMSDKKLKALMNKIQPTFTKFLPDGTIITMDSETGKVLDISKENLLNFV